ncbi:MAG: ligase-associated DNA damage response endonuclease PdeM [Hyphomicrobium sp.]|nr:ligase-associated DNA damage response endonuclease PdeM [Hyphomicrobium sp.]
MATVQLKPERLDAGEFDEQPISICGKQFRADVSGALYWPAENALVVADLHLEKASAYASKGVMLPPYDTRETLTRLAAALDRTDAATVIALGDSLHDGEGHERLSAEDRETLRIIQEDREWIWITGNHDPEVSETLGGMACESLTVEGITFCHIPRPGRITHEIAGHLHPAAKLSLHGHTFRRPCFVGNGLRLVMPAFGTFTGGLNILDEAFYPLFGNEGLSVWMLGQEGLYPVAARNLRPD